MATTNTVKLTFTYSDEKTRSYDLPVNEDDMVAVKSKIIALNESIAGGTDGGFSSFFVSDNGSDALGITAAQIISVSEKTLDLGGNN